MERDNLLRLAILSFGKSAQKLKAVEELSELTKELCKEMNGPPYMNCENILEEIADCKIMIRQMELIFGSADEWEEKKLQRLEERLSVGGGGGK